METFIHEHFYHSAYDSLSGMTSQVQSIKEMWLCVKYLLPFPVLFCLPRITNCISDSSVE